MFHRLLIPSIKTWYFSAASVTFPAGAISMCDWVLLHLFDRSWLFLFYKTTPDGLVAIAMNGEFKIADEFEYDRDFKLLACAIVALVVFPQCQTYCGRSLRLRCYFLKASANNVCDCLVLQVFYQGRSQTVPFGPATVGHTCYQNKVKIFLASNETSGRHSGRQDIV